MPDGKIVNDNKRIRQVTYLGIGVNILLGFIKLLVGMAAGSMALFADGVHSFSDLATDAAVLFGVRFGSKEPDKKHPYGHGRIETFSSVFISLALILVGGGMIYESARSIAGLNGGMSERFELGPGVVLVALFSVLLKEVLYWVTKMAAIKSHCSALYANAWHHRSDAFSSVAVLAGFISIRFGYAYGDQVAAIAVGMMILLVGGRIFGKCMEEFSERSVDDKTIEQITCIIKSNANILRWHNLRTRYVGREVFIDMNIHVNPNLSIIEAHEISQELENAIHEQISRPVNITVHVEPETDAAD